MRYGSSSLYSTRVLRIAGLESLIAVVLLLLSPAAVSAQGTQTLHHTGAAQVFTVPAGVEVVTIQAVGGGGGSDASGTAGGKGASVQGVFKVTPGEQLTVIVGGAGGNGSAASGNYASGGGGGGSLVYRGSGAGLMLLVAAGGGGGAGDVRCGEVSVVSGGVAVGQGSGAGGVSGEGGEQCG